MSYNAQEISVQSGSPVELYDIVLGSESWHYTTGEESVTVSAVAYTPLPILRDAIPVGKTTDSNEVAVVVPADIAFVNKYVLYIPGLLATLTIRRLHRTDTAAEVLNLFKGSIATVSFIDNMRKASIGVVPVAAKLGVSLPRFVFSNTCNHVLGDARCGLNLATGVDGDSRNMKYVGNVSALSGRTLTIDGIAVAGYPDGYFKGGRVLTAAGDTRLVLSQTGDAVALLAGLFEGSALVGHNVSIFTGCMHTLAVCSAKFSNTNNYGGFPAVVGKNPFTTGIK